MADIDTAQMRAGHAAIGCDACASPAVMCWLVMALDEVDRLRARLAEAEAELGRAVDAGAGPHVCQYAARMAEAETALNEKRGVAVRFKNLYIEALARAEAAEATIDECGCQTEAGWAEHDRVRALEARLAAVEAERDAAITGSREIRGALLAAEARLAEVEAELASEAESHRHSAAGRARAETRLAAVLALCDEAILAEAGRAVKFRTEFALLARAAAGDDRG